MLKNFEVFQLSKKLYWACKTLKIPSYLKDQLLRASSSVALNIAEGSAKSTLADQNKFYTIALGSLRECEAVFELELITDADLQQIVNQIGAILYSLTRRSTKTSRTK